MIYAAADYTQFHIVPMRCTPVQQCIEWCKTIHPLSVLPTQFLMIIEFQTDLDRGLALKLENIFKPFPGSLTDLVDAEGEVEMPDESVWL